MSLVNRNVISGFHNYNESEQIHFAQMRRVLGDVYSRHGFVPFTPRPVERIEDLKIGGIGHQVYQIARMHDGTLTDIGLPYDRTIQLAIWISQSANMISFPYKRQQIDYSWRGETPRAGRLRAFYQADVDIVGPNLSHMADVECISTIYEGLEALGFSNFKMCINHIGISKAMIASLGFGADQQKKILQLIDKLDKTPEEQIVNEIYQLDTSKDIEEIKKIVSAFKYQGILDEFQTKAEWGEAAATSVLLLKSIYSDLASYGLDTRKIYFSPGLARGLDYYTGVVFETLIEGQEDFGSVASGGRYDNLVAGFSNTNMGSLPGVGGSIGLTRIFEIFMKTMIGNKKLSTIKSDADVVVFFHTDSERSKALHIAKALREAGKKVDLYSQGNEVRLGDKLTYANKKGISRAIIVFDEEVSVKDLEKHTEEKFIQTSDAVNYFLADETVNGLFLSAM